MLRSCEPRAPCVGSSTGGDHPSCALEVMVPDLDIDTIARWRRVEVHAPSTNDGAINSLICATTIVYHLINFGGVSHGWWRLHVVRSCGDCVLRPRPSQWRKGSSVESSTSLHCLCAESSDHSSASTCCRRHQTTHTPCASALVLDKGACGWRGACAGVSRGHRVRPTQPVAATVDVSSSSTPARQLRAGLQCAVRPETKQFRANLAHLCHSRSLQLHLCVLVVVRRSYEREHSLEHFTHVCMQIEYQDPA
jgi:hypothetical protein